MGKRWSDQAWRAVRLVVRVSTFVGLIGLGIAVVGLMIGHEPTLNTGYALFSIAFIMAQAERLGSSRNL